MFSGIQKLNAIKRVFRAPLLAGTVEGRWVKQLYLRFNELLCGGHGLALLSGCIVPGEDTP